MKRLKVLILIFTAALTIPLAWFAARTWQGLRQEEAAELRYFAEDLFDRMEGELAEFVRREESRAIDEYNLSSEPPPLASAGEEAPVPALALPPLEDYILGYFQNNPDGSFQTPLSPDYETSLVDLDNLALELEDLNARLNEKPGLAPEPPPVPAADRPAPREDEQRLGPAGRYLEVRGRDKPKAHLGAQTKRVAQVSADMAQNVYQTERRDEDQETSAEATAGPETTARSDEAAAVGLGGGEAPLEEGAPPMPPPPPPHPPRLDQGLFKVEVDPMQSVFLDDDRVFIYRRIVLNNQVFRQGAVVKVRELLRHMAAVHFESQPMAAFAHLDLSVSDQGRWTVLHPSGAESRRPVFQIGRTFPRPFSFLQARLSCDRVPRSPGRTTLMLMSAVLGTVMLVGLLAIYRSARVVVELSQRRAGFVSSVTHELKTPLTNIRLYIEMLEQGIAQDPEREQEYFRILVSETARLSRLINNVLEFSKLESRKKRFEPREGDFHEVLAEVADVMREKVRQEGFILKIEDGQAGTFLYDREAMVQVLINLVDNSLKFGQNSPEREITLWVRPAGERVEVGVSDTGPGIPAHALKKVFDDFYRVDDSLTRNTRGTGIGLALVRRLVMGLGGRVKAENNRGPGCTVTVSLPRGPRPAA
ncbi:MAG: HAMP domain-containing sensor histidine kinase [Thermodesulfobacteriota bacterium]